MGKGEQTVIAGDEEEQVFGPPMGQVGKTGARPRRQDAQQAAQFGGVPLRGQRFEQEDSPRLVRRQRAQLADGAKLARLLFVQPQFGGGVGEGQVLGGGVLVNRPAQFAAQIAQQRTKIMDGLDVGEFVRHAVLLLAGFGYPAKCLGVRWSPLG